MPTPFYFPIYLSLITSTVLAPTTMRRRGVFIRINIFNDGTRFLSTVVHPIILVIMERTLRLGILAFKKGSSFLQPAQFSPTYLLTYQVCFSLLEETCVIVDYRAHQSFDITTRSSDADRSNLQSCYTTSICNGYLGTAGVQDTRSICIGEGLQKNGKSESLSPHRGYRY